MHSLISLVPFLLSTLPSVLGAPIEAAAAVSTRYPTATACAPPPCWTPPPANCPKPPSCDPWYQCPPQDWATKYPGSILATREAPGNWDYQLTYSGVLQLASKAYNVLFRTTDSHNEPTWAVTTIIKPKYPANKTRIMSYQHFYDSPDINHSPSCMLYENYTEATQLKLLIMRYLLAGWYVNVPDYEGVMAAYGAGRLSGQATLDSIRAAIDAAHAVDIFDRPHIAMYGYSGGSIATGWAAELASSYAPELEIKAAGIGGAIPKFENTLRHMVSASVFTNQIPSALVGLGNQWPVIQNLSMSVFNVSTWNAAKDAIRQASFSDIKTKYFDAMMEGTTMSSILKKDGDLGKAVPNMPLIIHRADDDALATTADTDALYEYYNNKGGNVWYHITPSHGRSESEGAHFTEGKDGAGGAIPSYMQDASEGKMPKGCHKVTKDWTTAELTLPYGTPVW